jgi:SPP1 gp7 family putative phage head morphogenesis protein
VNSEVLQGIVQGESIPKIAKRLRNVTEMNRASAIRNARTTVTSAENKGRMDSLHRAAEKGVITRKVWMAAIDARTRDAHRLLDGQDQDIDDPFKSILGDIMYPGDPNAEDPANVYNCRCSLTYKVIGFKRG